LYNQDDWLTLLGQASFAYNNSLHSGIGFSPFYANFGYHPQWIEELQPVLDYDIPAGQQVVSSLVDLHWQCLANLAEANIRSAEYYNSQQRPTPDFEIGDLVLLNVENFCTLRPSKKLDIRSGTIPGHRTYWDPRIQT